MARDHSCDPCKETRCLVGRARGTVATTRMTTWEQ
jgi:hypothetical protein